MFIEIDELKEEPLHFQHAYAAGELAFEHEDATLAEPVVVDFILTHDDRDLRLGGTVDTALLCKCSRCLSEFSRGLSAGFDLCYLPQPKWKQEGVEIELKYEDMEVGFYDGIRLDVDLMVLEQIELSIPMRFICKEDCRGLCYRCGRNLNEGDCGCDLREPDSRLSVLLEFRKKTER